MARPPSKKPPVKLPAGSAGKRLSRERRVALTEEVAGDILAVYRAMGGPAFLLEWAQKNPDAFVKDCWSRIAPAALKESPDVAVQVNTSVGGGLGGDIEAARRIAFALSRAVATEEDRKAALLGSPARPPVELQDPDPGAQAAEALEMKQEADREAERTYLAEQTSKRLEEQWRAQHAAEEQHWNTAEQGIRRTSERHSRDETVRRKR